MELKDQPVIDNEIASEDEVTVISGGAGWRFAHGKIVSGQEIDGKPGEFEKEKEKIVGRLVRVGIFDGIGKSDGNPYSQIEADIETVEGILHVKGGLTDPDEPGKLKPSVSTIKFAWGLTQFKEGEQLCITADRSKERVTLPNGRQGGYVTYVNFARLEKKIVKVDGVDKIRWVGTPVYSPKRAPDAEKVELADQWLALRPLIEAHPAYKERAPREDDGGENANFVSKTHLGQLCAECKAKGWPTPEQAPLEWLEMASIFFEEPAKKSLRELSDEFWGELRLAVNDRPADDPPKGLRPFMEKLAGEAAPAAAAAAPRRSLD